MNINRFGLNSRSLTIAVAALAAVISLGLGANAALNKLTKPSSAISSKQDGSASDGASRLALIVGNGHYPDAGSPLTQPINDARALAHQLRGDGFDVDMIEDARKDDMKRAVERLSAKIKPDSVVMLFFGGFGVQAGRESFMIPVDAAIWKEADVRRDGMSVEYVLSEIKQRGARAKLVVIDASRRNPYERRFRSYSRGLAPIEAPENALILSSATPDKVADDSHGDNSALVAELLNNMKISGGAEKIFNRTRVTVSRNSEGEQVPTVSSTLVDDIRIGSRGASAGG